MRDGCVAVCLCPAHRKGPNLKLKIADLPESI